MKSQFGIEYGFFFVLFSLLFTCSLTLSSILIALEELLLWMFILFCYSKTYWEMYFCTSWFRFNLWFSWCCYIFLNRLPRVSFQTYQIFVRILNFNRWIFLHRSLGFSFRLQFVNHFKSIFCWLSFKKFITKNWNCVVNLIEYEKICTL